MKLYASLRAGDPGIVQPAKLGEIRLCDTPGRARQVSAHLNLDFQVIVEVDIDEYESELLIPLAYDADLMLDEGWLSFEERTHGLTDLAHEIDPWATDDALVQVPTTGWWVSLRITGTCLSYGGEAGWVVRVLDTSAEEMTMPSSEPASIKDDVEHEGPQVRGIPPGLEKLVQQWGE